jgi:uncharacterized membrane protein
MIGPGRMRHGLIGVGPGLTANSAQPSAPRIALGEIGMDDMRLALILVAAILLQAGGNTCLSLGMKHVASLAATHPDEWLTAVASPLNVTGVLLLIAFFALFTIALARADLSVVVPIISFEIVLNVALAQWLIHEDVSPIRWAGAALVTCGVALVALSSKPAEKGRGAS